MTTETRMCHYCRRHLPIAQMDRREMAVGQRWVCAKCPKRQKRERVRFVPRDGALLGGTYRVLARRSCVPDEAAVAIVCRRPA